jgi:hypothetical protein
MQILADGHAGRVAITSAPGARQASPRALELRALVAILGRMQRHSRIVVFCLIGLLCSASGASAQEDGVTVDPESPSAKEYAIPLDAARRQANPNDRARAQRTAEDDPAPLFGAGIIDKRPPARRRDPPRSGTGRASGSDRSHDSDARKSASGRPPPSVIAARAGTPESGLGATLLVMSVAVLVLALGAALGYLLRRRRLTR